MSVNKNRNSSTTSTSSSTYKRKNTHSSTRKRQMKNAKEKTVDPIDAFVVFTSDDLESNASSKTSSSLENFTPLQKRRPNYLQPIDSEDDDFYPKTQSVRKDSQSTRKTKSTTKLKTTPIKVACVSNQSKESTPPKTNPVLLTPKKTTSSSTEPKQSTSGTPSKQFVEMKLNSPKKNSPSSTQQKPKINVLSSTVIKKPENVQNIQEAGTSGTGKKISVCRNIFGTENPNKKETINTVLKDYDVNVRFSNKTLKGKINISTEKKVISIDLTDENDSMETEESTCSELETPKKSPTKTTNLKTQHSKIVETPLKSPKKVKPKDTKSYTQSSLLSYVGNSKPSTSKNIEIDKNKVKSSAIKTNSKYTIETNTRVYENVQNIMKWVFEKEHFSILFTKNETDLLNNFFNLSDTKLTILCLRLFTRQHKWYNLTNLCTELNLKDESYNYHDVLTHINEVYVHSDYTEETVDVLLDHLQAADLREICNSFKISAPTRKEAMRNKLLEYTSKQCTLTFVKNSDQILRDRIEEKLGICVKLKPEFKNILYMIHLLYSLTYSFTTINDIYNIINIIKSNAVKYPSIQTDSTKVFADRQDFLNYAEATQLRKEYDDQFLKKDLGSQYLLCVEAHKRLSRLLNNAQQVGYDTLKPLFLRRFSASWIYCKVLSSGSLNLGKHYPEQVCEWLTDMLKQNIYCLYKRGQWYIQLSLINQSHLKKFVDAADNIISGINDKDVAEVTKYELSIRGSKIRKTKLPQLKFDELQYVLLPNLTIPVERTFEAKAASRNEQKKGKLYFERITEDGKEYGSVEETAIYYYKENHNYTYGYHCEGRLLSTLFVIFFWDILYEMNVPNTFISEIQSFPLDLFSTDFYTNRQEKIDERLNDIRNKWNVKQLCDFFSSKFLAHNEEISAVANFECDNEKTFHEIIQSIGKVILAAVFERFAKDYKQFHSGLPDLFLWNREFKCAFVEVKSENDTLSTNQILWINYLHSFQACVEVCHVLNKGSKKMKKKTNNQEA